uniref:Uncharacterized protein n=1 Tax=Arcella intermedia TaxID=1963864 RepID=A0A6B2LIF4_9EUKA
MGYFLDEKRRQKLRWNEFLDIVRDRKDIVVKGVEDMDLLEEDGPFDVFLLRVTDQLSKDDAPSQGIITKLQRYFAKHPDIKILDPIENQQKVIRRELMADLMDKLNAHSGLNLRCPTSLIIDFNDPNYLDKLSSLKFPLICKSLSASGTKLAHLMGIIFTADHFKQVVDKYGETNWILQEYINHNGTIFKVYVLEESYMISRASLPNYENQKEPFFL